MSRAASPSVKHREILLLTSLYWNRKCHTLFRFTKHLSSHGNVVTETIETLWGWTWTRPWPVLEAVNLMTRVQSNPNERGISMALWELVSLLAGRIGRAWWTPCHFDGLVGVCIMYVTETNMYRILLESPGSTPSPYHTSVFGMCYIEGLQHMPGLNKQG
jgi:hypothetical protein